MTRTRIAGLAFDARQAREIRQTASIYSYTRHIRRIAMDAEPAIQHVPLTHESPDRNHGPSIVRTPRLAPVGPDSS